MVSITERIRSYWQQVIPGRFLLELNIHVIMEIVSPTIAQYPPTIIHIEPKSRAAFPLSVRVNDYLILSYQLRFLAA